MYSATCRCAYQNQNTVPNVYQVGGLTTSFASLSAKRSNTLESAGKILAAKLPLVLIIPIRWEMNSSIASNWRELV
jgi:hypothetical protein